MKHNYRPHLVLEVRSSLGLVIVLEGESGGGIIIVGSRRI